MFPKKFKKSPSSLWFPKQKSSIKEMQISLNIKRNGPLNNFMSNKISFPLINSPINKRILDHFSYNQWLNYICASPSQCHYHFLSFHLNAPLSFSQQLFCFGCLRRRFWYSPLHNKLSHITKVLIIYFWVDLSPLL